ncbi:MAG: hypothetical protein IJR65_03570, partial [Oscillospiraceae bacterium]|nr:hypothetical protein [Oscillospiraceae bacterium]
MQLKIDENFAEKVIPANDSVRLLDRVIEEMDISALMRAYDPYGRPPATPPRTMLKITEKVEKLLPVYCEKYGVMAEEAGALLAQLEARVDFPFVHGRGNRKSEL